MSIWLLTMWCLFAEAQDRQWTVCAGDTGVAYFVSGWETSTYNWSVEGGSIRQHYGDTILVDWPFRIGTFSISVQEISESGCGGEVKTGLVEVLGPVIDLGVDSYICDGEVFEISPSGNFTSYLWSDGSTGPSFSTQQAGWINLEVSDPNACTARDSIYLSVMNLPSVDLSRDTVLCGDQQLILDGGTDGSFFNWSTGDISRTLRVYRDGKQDIWVVVEDAFGCIDSDTISIDQCNLSFYFSDIPTAITPNGDGWNDVWEIDKLADYGKAVVEIFNQWGILVWRSEPGYSLPWDGRDMNGRLVPVDSYHFIMEFNDGSKEYYVGIVTVIR
jgi:gliding motility-associated-like protein